MNKRIQYNIEWNKANQKRINLGLNLKEYEELQELMKKNKIKYVIEVLRIGMNELKKRTK